MNALKFFSANKVQSAAIGFNGTAEKDCQKLVRDLDYAAFLKAMENGGFYFEHSLQIYSFDYTKSFTDVEFVNQILVEQYGALFSNLISFGQDVFGNQFALDTQTKSVIFFNCEAATRETICEKLGDWPAAIQNDFKYYTGIQFCAEWRREHDFKPNDRLIPKKPFIIGGAYDNSNFFTLSFPRYFDYYSDLARQIVNLQDGQKVRIVLKKMD